MATSYDLSIDTAALNKAGMDLAFRRVTDTTRRVLNRAIVLTPVDTGNLRAQNKSSVRRATLKVTGRVWNSTSYAAAVHDGSRAHTIRPKRKKALRFVVAGNRVVFARSVQMPARRGRPWLFRALTEVAGREGYQITR